MDFSSRELGLKHLSGGKCRPEEGSASSIRTARQPHLASTDLELFELNIVPSQVRRIADQDNGIALTTRPFDVDPPGARIFDNAIEDIVGRNGQDAGSNLLQRQLDRVSFGDARPRDDRNHRLHTPLAQPEGEDDVVQLENHARFVDFGRELVGEMRNQILRQPGVHLLIGEHRLPGRLIADIVAELETLRDEFSGLALSLFASLEDDVAIIRRLIGQAEPHPCGQGRQGPQDDPGPEEPPARLAHETSQSSEDGDGWLETTIALGREEEGSLGVPETETWSNHIQPYDGSGNRSTRTEGPEIVLYAWTHGIGRRSADPIHGRRVDCVGWNDAARNSTYGDPSRTGFRSLDEFFSIKRINDSTDGR